MSFSSFRSLQKFAVASVFITFISCNYSTSKKDVIKDTTTIVNAPIDSLSASKAPNDYNNLARFIAGTNQDNENDIKKMEATPYWSNFSNNITQKFKILDSTRYFKMRAWRDTELKEVNTNTEKLFYPFSGPDFLNAFTFFPNAKEYTMLALEPAGKLPSIDELKLDTAHNYFASIENGLKAILSFSFFRTEAMEQDFANNQLNGAVHLVSLFVIKTGNKIIDVKPATINNLGEIVLTDKNDCTINGFQILFEDGITHQNKIINYFSIDVSDLALQTNPCFKAFANKLQTVTTYLKSASYLLHSANFSFMRNTIIAHSKNILQDDSGIPLSFFKDTVWNKTFYGTYDKPINLFRNKYQANVHKVYNDSLSKVNIKKLPFGIGYDYKQNESNLMLFRKK